jgi:glucosamine 6-phosphate synthetase-like amidotransferase/phosphosugar isomerase protein
VCGIAGIHRLTDRPMPKLDEFASELLAGIQHRGSDATGFVGMNDDGAVQLQKASCSAYYFNQHRAPLARDTRTVLLHTRFATQGKPAFPENNHPVEAGGIYCVHNGHVNNDSEVFEKPGVGVRRGQVDSEAIPALVAAKGWESLPESLEVLQGAVAVAMLNEQRPGELVLARGYSSPLVVLQTRHLIVWASTVQAIEDAWARVLGTPPNPTRRKYLVEGSALVVNRGNVEEKRFQSYEPPRVTYTVRHSTPNLQTVGGTSESFALRSSSVMPITAGTGRMTTRSPKRVS